MLKTLLTIAACSVDGSSIMVEITDGGRTIAKRTIRDGRSLDVRLRGCLIISVKRQAEKYEMD